METGKKEVFAAVVLAAGRGKRMESSVHKQYLLLHEKPVLYYALKAFEESPVQEIVLVVGKGEIEYCQKEIVEKYGFQKISHIIEGGAERYPSVYCGLKAIKGADYVLIHDGARPFFDEEIIKRNIQAVREYQACVAGMPVKDTIKISDEEEFAAATPDRSKPVSYTHLMKEEFDVNLTPQDMYRFNMYHTYHGFHGILSIVMAILVIIVTIVTWGDLDATYSAIYLVLAALFVGYIPVSYTHLDVYKRQDVDTATKAVHDKFIED